MLLIYLAAIIIMALFTSGIVYYYSIEKKAAFTLTGLSLLLAIFFTHFYIYPYYENMRFGNKLASENAILALLANNAPNDFAAYVQKVKSATKQQADEQTDIFINNEIAKYAPHASNASLYQFAKTSLALYQLLLTKDPAMVLQAEFPDKFIGKTDYALLQTEAGDFSAKIATDKHDIIQSAITNPRPPLTDEEIKKARSMVGGIIDELSKKYGEEVVLTTFQQPADPTLDKKLAATVVISFYEKMIAAGEENTGLMIRTLLFVSTQPIAKNK